MSAPGQSRHLVDVAQNELRAKDPSSLIQHTTFSACQRHRTSASSYCKNTRHTRALQTQPAAWHEHQQPLVLGWAVGCTQCLQMSMTITTTVGCQRLWTLQGFGSIARSSLIGNSAARWTKLARGILYGNGLYLHAMTSFQGPLNVGINFLGSNHGHDACGRRGGGGRIP